MNNAIDFSDEVSQIQTDCPYIKNADYILNRLIESIKETIKQFHLAINHGLSF